MKDSEQLRAHGINPEPLSGTVNENRRGYFRRYVNLSPTPGNPPRRPAEGAQMRRSRPDQQRR